MSRSEPMPPGLLQWRPMTATDLPAVKALADLVHVAYPEDETVFADRLTHHPAGCFVLQGADAPVGYVISHPWQFARPPRLNTRLDRPALPPSTYYIHDLALLPAARGSGAAAAIVDVLAAHAADLRLPNITLVAVGNSVHFWRRQGFDTVIVDPDLDRQLRSYDEHACFMSRKRP
ncbi:GNAT family N-acetyltransferase [Rhodopseudomonas sp. RCAM05734]|uniref:GNAT family N-acetyltransferase n=1 Tax=Rhodopseudomonas sp. RCAM05734 TaxID=3457549 RepID=UPI004044E0DB